MNMIPNKKMKAFNQKKTELKTISPDHAVPEAMPIKTELSEERLDEHPDKYYNNKGDLWFVRESQRAHEAKEKMKTAIGRKRRSSQSSMKTSK